MIMIMIMITIIIIIIAIIIIIIMMIIILRREHQSLKYLVFREVLHKNKVATLHPLPKTSARNWNKNCVDKKKWPDFNYRHRRTDRSSPELT